MQNAYHMLIKKILILASIAVVTVTTIAAPTWATSRIKDLVNIEGIRDNQLIGYGLVVGLNGTGDTLRNAPFTDQSLKAMLERLGINAKDAEMKPENTAAVMVTANATPVIPYPSAGQSNPANRTVLASVEYATTPGRPTARNRLSVGV